MNPSFQVTGIKTSLIKPGDNLIDHILNACDTNEISLQEHDILILAESAVATAQGRISSLVDQIPSQRAFNLAERFDMDPALVEIILKESDDILGGIPGFLLCTNSGHLLPNAGVDGSNAPPGYVTLLPVDPDKTASSIRYNLYEKTGFFVAVLIIDSRTHMMRYGCGGVALACSGIPGVIDERGREDLFGKELKVTRRAVADNLASAAELVMGEADESVPLVLIRGFDIAFGDYNGIETINPEECLFIGGLKNKEKL
jgi:coenzyme F420-0:L-glutamate ligase / coenzyme F420-1:gamma-L-glutamate ligase